MEKRHIVVAHFHCSARGLRFNLEGKDFLGKSSIPRSKLNEVSVVGQIYASILTSYMTQYPVVYVTPSVTNYNLFDFLYYFQI
jgi:hypothetical protein